jgi:hypothetical protein
VPNEPIAGIRLVDLEYRGNGGRAYKVVLPCGYYVDLREDILLELARSVGISEGGILNGEYIWIRMPGGMKLVRIGSSYYENIIKMVKKEEENKEKKLLSKTKLQVGNVYRVGRSYYVFLGFVSTIGAKKARGSANTTYIKHNKACLWYNCYAGTTNVLQSIQADLTSQYKTNTHYTEIKTSMIKAVDLVDQITIPTDVVEGARQATLADIQKDIANYTSNPKTASTSWYGYSSYDSQEYRHKRLVETIEYHLEKALMVPYGEKIEVPSMISDWLPNLKLLPKK